MDSLYNVLLGLSQRRVNKRLDWCFSKNSCMYHTHTHTPVSVRLLLYTRRHALGKSCPLSKKDTFLNCICSEFQRGLKAACSFCGLCYSVHNYKLDPETFKAAVSSDMFYMMGRAGAREGSWPLAAQDGCCAVSHHKLERTIVLFFCELWIL